MSSVQTNLIPQRTVVWRFPLASWVLLVVALCVAVFSFQSGLAVMVDRWGGQGEYSYGYLIPLISLFLIWQKKNQLASLPLTGSWWGLVVVLFGVTAYGIGELSTLYLIVQYSFLAVIAGLTLALVGWRGLQLLLAPLGILIFMVPLPEFIFQGLSLNAQLISSNLGVEVIKLFDIPVYLEGNVIDLGAYKLQVAEACNGLRYLFPLMVVGFIMAYFFKLEMWKRIVIFMSAIPLTIIMNSFRIGVIGVTVQYWGVDAAKGFLHEFEGWIVFMVCTALLVGEMWLLSRLSRDRRPLRSVFGLELPAPIPSGTNFEYRRLPRAFILAVGSVGIALLLSETLPNRAEIIPNHQSLSTFPFTIDGWRGQEESMSQTYVDALKFDDYILANFQNASDVTVNFYVAYYKSQRKGASAHSPRSCIPGDGWEISDFSQRAINGTKMGGSALTINRAVIKKGKSTQLVYYWFQQRGRVISNEYLVKWFIFWDALTKNRTDGALVRVIAPVNGDQPIAHVDAELTNFIGKVAPHLAAFIPGA